jgi:hypothetical protein
VHPTFFRKLDQRCSRHWLTTFVGVGIALSSACTSEAPSADGTGTAGTLGTAGVQATAGASATAGTLATAGTGNVDIIGPGTAGGIAQSTSGTGTGSGAGDGASNTDGGSGNADCTAEGATEHFSFFVTSLEGLRKLAGDQNGFGGDLRFGKADGLSGADEICRQLAEAAYEGAGCKTWHAFLSVTKDAGGNPVNAVDRISDGPWYDRLGRLVANNKTDLLTAWPTGADAAIKNDLPNEFGVPNHNPDGKGIVDNHNSITGSKMGGMLHSSDWAFTCHDWTSKVGTDGTPAIGFSWLGGASMFPGTGWYYGGNITEGGCAPIINLKDSMNFSERGIGSRGGYGGFYCLADEP